jgi:hypothetical protein
MKSRSVSVKLTDAEDIHFSTRCGKRHHWLHALRNAGRSVKCIAGRVPRRGSIRSEQIASS